MFKFYKLLFFTTMIMGTTLAVSSYSWMSMWIGLEINLLSIIPLMNNNNSMSSESSIKYFLSQAMASMILLFSLILIMNINEIMNNFMLSNMFMMMNASFFMKMGAAPLHFWFPEIMEGLSWMNNLILMTWQKIAPMILVYYNMKINFMIMIIIFSTIVGSIMGLNQISMRKIMAYSSINHISWMLASLLNSLHIWTHYFLIYSIITVNLIMIFNKFNIFMLKQLLSSLNSKNLVKLFFIMNFMSLGGLPPFLGFYPKWITINNLLNNNFYLITMLMILFTLITLYFYLRVTFSVILFNNSENLNLFHSSSWAIILLNFMALILMMGYILNFMY
uniref:NADH-ubiquinone oxidoreductase chain 2 n=1 Tax=Cucujoidea sp. 44 KM-2017 TaxID=2219383 RepID=A0A346RHG4_9CUCU|nr:NADH dehydrogenase subunit 2 [Cucujoidea sp. 44 KM-2017]